VKRLLFLATLALGLMAAPAQAQRIAPGGKRAEARVQSGVASYYARSLHGNRTASGERYNHGAMTVAHRSLPFGTLLRVRSERSGRAVLVRVNDRGPFIRGRVLDLSGAAADRLRMKGRGTARVSYEVVDPATLPSRQAPPPQKVQHL
jgi:rare lipoprotein A